MKAIKPLIFFLTLVVIAAGFWWWWDKEKHYPSTQDAYLHANIVTIAPQIAGRVEQVAIEDNQRVEAGDLLFQLDTAMLETELNSAKAEYELAKQSVGASESQVLVAQANLVSAKASLTQAQVDYDRIVKLYSLKNASKADYDNTKTALDAANADLAAAQAQLQVAKTQAGVAGSANPTIRQALADLSAAQINLGYSRIAAPASGWLANVDLRPDTIVSAGQSLFSLVEDGDWWVEANFKETALGRVRAGQSATISIDMYSGKELAGVVDSIGAGSGAVFSLLPSENATGNWVKVTQRFPVRIKVKGKPDDDSLQLRVGASVKVTIDTTSLDEQP